jgi:hypothetical protein
MINSIAFFILLYRTSPALLRDTPSLFILNKGVFKSLSQDLLDLLTAG